MDVLMPQLGETVAEGKIVKWFKSAGDQVAAGDTLFEIETDKTSMEVPATVAGTLSDIRFQAGETARVGAVVAVIAGADEAAQPAAARASSPSASQSPLVPAKAGTQMAQTQKEPGPRLRGNEPSEGSFAYPHMDLFREVRTPERNHGPANVGGVSVTPLARRLASERGIDLNRVTGSGPHGRIRARDLEQAQPVPVAAPGTGAGAAPGAAQVKALFDGVAYEEVPLDPMRRTIAARLTEAVRSIPHFYLTADVDIGRLAALREEANAAAPHGADGAPLYRLSLTDLIVKAWAAALTRVPAANAVWAEDRILRFAHADIGVAVALDGGLITPVVRNADTKPLSALSAELRDLAARARDKKLKPAEYQGGASAVSNLGMHGVRAFSAIVNPPHATILAVGAARRAPVETPDGGVTFVSRITVTLSCDHRVVDGQLAAKLLATFNNIVENPLIMMV